MHCRDSGKFGFSAKNCFAYILVEPRNSAGQGNQQVYGKSIAAAQVPDISSSMGDGGVNVWASNSTAG
jgi:hypothetical protein